VRDEAAPRLPLSLAQFVGGDFTANASPMHCTWAAPTGGQAGSPFAPAVQMGAMPFTQSGSMCFSTSVANCMPQQQQQHQLLQLQLQQQHLLQTQMRQHPLAQQRKQHEQQQQQQQLQPPNMQMRVQPQHKAGYADMTRSSHGVTSEGESTRGSVTTLMIRNLPREVTQSDLLQELDTSGFAERYDFAYLPSSFEELAGKGYAFVNFVSTHVAGTFSAGWHKSGRCGAPSPFLNLSPATVQGLEANIHKWAGQRMDRIRNPALRPFVRRSADSARVPPQGAAAASAPSAAAAVALAAVAPAPQPALQPPMRQPLSAKWQGPQRRQPQRRAPVQVPVTTRALPAPMAVGRVGGV